VTAPVLRAARASEFEQQLGQSSMGHKVIEANEWIGDLGPVKKLEGV
jgi:hypothetical protein